MASASEIEILEFSKGPPSKRDGERILCCNFLYYAKTEFNYVCRGVKPDGKKCYSSITLDKDKRMSFSLWPMFIQKTYSC